MNKFLAYITCLMLAATGQVSGASIYPEADISIPKLKRIVKEFTGVRPARNYMNVRSLNKVSSSISDKLTALGYKPRYQEYIYDNKTYRNVIAVIGPAGTKKIILGAHYDVCGNTPGADDNASGLAGLITIAKLLKANEHLLKKQVEIVAYTLEEPPFFRSKNMGSYIHAKSLNESKEKIVGMVCLEMIGYYTEKNNSQKYPDPSMLSSYPSKGNFIALVSNARSATFSAEFMRHFKKADIDMQLLVSSPVLLGVDFSDHLNYWRFQYPAIMITDTSLFRNPNYHKSTDVSSSLNYEKMRETIRGAFFGVLNIASE